MPSAFSNVPGLRNGPSITPRNIFNTQANLRWLSSDITIDGTLSRDTGNSPTSLLRAGLFLGKITTGGKYRPSIIGVLSASSSSAAGTNSTTLTVPAAVATEVARLIALNGTNTTTMTLTGPPTAAGTVASLTIIVTAASGTTITAGSTSANMALGSILQPADGSQIPFTVLGDGILPYLDVTDLSGNSQDVMLPKFLSAGDLYAPNIINYQTSDDGTTAVDTSVSTFLRSLINTATRGNDFTFSDTR